MLPVMSTALAPTASAAAPVRMTVSPTVIKPADRVWLSPAMAAAAAAATAAATQTSQTSQTVNTSDPVVPDVGVPGSDVSNPVQFVPVMPIVLPDSAPTPIWKNPYFWLAVGGGVVVAGTGIYLIRRRRKS